MEAVIEAVPSLTVIGKAANGIEAIALIKRLKPDCALLDLSMPGANGLQVFQDAKRWSPQTRFVIITGISAASLFRQLYEAGIDGLFVKNSPPDIISAGIVRIANGERVISEEAMAAIESDQVNTPLSKREQQVLEGLAKGHTNKQVSETLGVSAKTVDTHRTNLLRKMNVNTTAALLVTAMKTGLLDI